MKKYIILIYVTLLMINNKIIAQNIHKDSFDPSIILQVPERSKFQNLTENFSVDHFIGQPNIQIPLYTINEYDIQIPISLKYRAGGLKVDVENGYLGLNWDLLVAGEIRRTIMGGMPDDLHNSEAKGYNYINENIPGYQENNRKEFIDLLKNYDYDFSPLTFDCNILKQSETYGNQYSDGRFDAAPDVYNFNIMGLNGTFTTIGGGLFKVENLQSNEWVDIVYLGNDGFEIKDARGNSYIFGEKEYHTHKYRTAYYGGLIDWLRNPIKKYKYILSWKLSKIISSSGEVVSFYYNTHDNVDPAVRKSLYSNQSTYVNYYYPKVCVEGIEGIIPAVETPRFSYDSKEEEEEYDYKYLTKISSANTIVDFYYKGSHGMPKLEAIMIYAKNDLEHPIKKYEIESSDIYHLNSIKEYGSGSLYNEYKITYFTLPSFERFGIEKDHWGYYSPNTKQYASGINNFNIGYNSKFQEDSIWFGHRNTKTKNVNSGMIKSITYPTGGRVSFEWEPHDYSQKSELLKTPSMTDGYFEGHEITAQREYKEISRTINQNTTSTQIYVNTNYLQVTIDLEEYYPKPGTFILDCNHNNAVTFCRCILGWEDSNHYLNELPYIKISGPNNFSKKIVIKKDNVWKKHEITLGEKGSYKYEIINAGNELIKDQGDLCYDFYTHIMDKNGNYGKVKITFKEEIESEEYLNKRDNTFLTGGVRVKEIIFEGRENKVRRLFNYSLNPYDKKAPSSGVLTKAPKYGHTMKISQPDYICPSHGHIEGASLFFDKYIISTMGLPKTPEGSGHIEYSQVTEFVTNLRKQEIINNVLDSASSTNVTIYEFWTSADGMHYCDKNETLNLNNVSNGQLMLTSNHFNRGHLKRKKEYTEEEKITEYSYSILDKRDLEFISGGLFTIRDFTPTVSCYDYTDRCGSILNSTYCYHKDFGIVRYKIIPYNKRISEIKESGTVSNKHQKYTYFNQSYSAERLVNSPISESTVNSKGDTIVNYYTYTNKNKIHTCVTACNGKITSAYRNEYDQLGNLLQIFVAEISPSSTLYATEYRVGSSTISANHPIVSLTNKCIETRQYERNRLCEVTDHNSNTSTVYIWGYNGEYPIAEIKNFTLSERNLLLGNEINNLFESFDPEDITILNSLRSELKESLITTYTYKMKIGVTSETDPRGISTYYEYDSFGRLNAVYIGEKDAEGYETRRLIKNAYDYHYSK